MPVKVFITGATGYIGGDTLYHVHQQHPNFEYALLVRSEDKAKTVKDKYPNARIVIASLDDSATLEREASWADIVIRLVRPVHHWPHCANKPRHCRLIRPCG
jgi:N-acetyl-gamma-glutamylphosphate reductase